MHRLILYFFVKSETPLSLVLSRIQIHNLLIFGLATKSNDLSSAIIRLTGHFTCGLMSDLMVQCKHGIKYVHT